MEEAFFVKQGDVSELRYVRQKMISFTHTNAITNLMTQCLTIQLLLTPRTFIDQDYHDYKENQKKKGRAVKIQRNFFQDVELGDSSTSQVGLVNEGTTCYINSMLQTLFSLG